MISKHFTFAAIYKWGGLLTFYKMCFMCFYATCAFQQRWTCLFISMFGSSSVDTSQVIKMRDNRYGAEMNVCFRCCWGCWQAPRSSFPHAAAAAATLRSPTTSFRWQAVRSGQNSLQQTKKLHTIIKIGNQFIDSYMTTGFFFCPCLTNAKSNSQSVICGLSSPSGVIITQKGHLPSRDNSSNDASVFCRFGLLPLSMSNLHKSKSSSRAPLHQLVSVTFGIWYSLLLTYVLTSTTYCCCSLFVPCWGNVFCCFPSFFELENTRQVCVHVCVWL